MSGRDEAPAKGIINAFGLVFGDIGTSPIYTLSVIFLVLPPERTNVIGVLSCIIWTLILLVTVEYSWLAMSLGRRGEGGTIVLQETLLPLLSSGRQAAFVTILTYLGISLLAGDGVITPAISILSAVEGILLIPGCERTPNWILVGTAIIIAALLFAWQKKGTDRVAGFFGPLMVVWFVVLSISGLAALWTFPSVLAAFSPLYAINFLGHHGVAGFFLLSEVTLCATGGEALYADMGHLGRSPIRRAWALVMPALILCYLGQGAFIILHPENRNILFAMLRDQAPLLYVPFLLLSLIATIIASQAMISGMFSIVYQGIMARILPLLKVDFTSKEVRSQIYIDAVNWLLFAAVVIVMLSFGESSRLAAAYGLAVTGTMTLTGIMMTWIFSLRKQHGKACLALLVTLVDMVYLGANTLKIPHGGYWSLLVAAIPLGCILLYTRGQKRLYKTMAFMDLEPFLKEYHSHYRKKNRIQGSALYFTRDIRRVPPFMVQTMLINHILYDDNIVVSITRLDEPYGAAGSFRECYDNGLRLFEIRLGYMQVADIPAILKKAGIHARTIFYGVEEIITTNPLWRLFAALKRLTPTYVQFYNLPADRLHGVMTRVRM
ncbi:MAG: potassium transporter Kup [Deltaproteobacteria bacterium RIFOXYD12_FULL_57_12]|nr:MAG: potassium transporter Kup [Deltaproteobacteria bacterium RIFOXYD12_FULL_57_12]